MLFDFGAARLHVYGLSRLCVHRTATKLLVGIFQRRGFALLSALINAFRLLRACLTLLFPDRGRDGYATNRQRQQTHLPQMHIVRLRCKTVRELGDLDLLANLAFVLPLLGWLACESLDEHGLVPLRVRNLAAMRERVVSTTLAASHGPLVRCSLDVLKIDLHVLPNGHIVPV